MFGEPRNAVKLTYRESTGASSNLNLYLSAPDILATYRFYLKHSCDRSSVSTLFRSQLLDKHGTIYIDEKKSQHQHKVE